MCSYWIFYFTDSTKATQYIIHLYTFYTCHCSVQKVDYKLCINIAVEFLAECLWGLYGCRWCSHWYKEPPVTIWTTLTLLVCTIWGGNDKFTIMTKIEDIPLSVTFLLNETMKLSPLKTQHFSLDISHFLHNVHVD